MSTEKEASQFGREQEGSKERPEKTLILYEVIPLAVQRAGFRIIFPSLAEVSLNAIILGSQDFFCVSPTSAPTDVYRKGKTIARLLPL